MKLITYRKDKSISCGILADERIIDIPTAWKDGSSPRSIKEILEKGPSCLAKLAELADLAGDFIPLETVRLLAPIPRPGW